LFIVHALHAVSSNVLFTLLHCVGLATLSSLLEVSWVSFVPLIFVYSTAPGACFALVGHLYSFEWGCDWDCTCRLPWSFEQWWVGEELEMVLKEQKCYIRVERTAEDR
jgi:hypothetical protein